MQLREMGEQDCLAFLASHTRGHLACLGEKYPYIVPIQYAYEKDRLFVFSMPGLKIDLLRAHSPACVQVEEFGENQTWKSVLVQGTYDELTDTPARHDERIHAWSLLQKQPFWWEPGSLALNSEGEDSPAPSIFFGISIEVVSGRQVV
ncbi:pyridoxamine 5'-phosphate oxidase family protein [Rhizobium leguminosarum]|uniref:pyridoxamine 5'-phosphate oxidase family protein n=1 Tax=Rhizobium leguminosarum TaxID=384 RepID=UPI0014415DD1|nr:pyridoxamine 5'-phosphate oxidase family protein [Rhizobium leguminosarum]NKM01374.1 pyridoxamine 5'-phosphate oxidase family protein [Rhizobium leguminosarum bv. viciae]